jgi:sec-independent protein translocase protein TatA
MPSLGWQELVIVLVIVIIIFGAGRLPEIGGALGKSIKEFKTNSEDGTEIDAGTSTTVSQTAAQPAQPKVVASKEVRADEI